MGRLRDTTDLHTALVTGASSGIGLAVAEWLLQHTAVRRLILTAREPGRSTELQDLCARYDRAEILRLDLGSGDSLRDFGAVLAPDTRVDLCINTAGILHKPQGMQPEKRLADCARGALLEAFTVNAAGAILLAQTLEPCLRRSPAGVYAALSARVGSIGDNRSGGWYAYRASKAALNMLIRTLAIEWARLRPPLVCVGLHPGTVATELSAPFTAGYSGTVFTPAESADSLCTVIDQLSARDSGHCLAWDGSTIDP